MKTIEIKVYEFSELSDKAKQVAIDSLREQADTSEEDYSNAYKSVKKFNDIFRLKEGSRSWLDCRFDQIDDVILELKGWRLATYLWNNYRRDLYKGKYYSLWSKKEKSFKYYKEGYPVLKTRHSKVMLDTSCVLTGWCWDEDLLDPIRKFMDNPDDTDFESLLNDCLESLRISLERNSEASRNDENVTEYIENNEYEFTKDGHPF